MPVPAPGSSCPCRSGCPDWRRAKATAVFENGLIRYPGIYLNNDGQPSSDQKLQDDKKYHNYSYVINTTNDYYKPNSFVGVIHELPLLSFCCV